MNVRRTGIAASALLILSACGQVATRASIRDDTSTATLVPRGVASPVTTPGASAAQGAPNYEAYVVPGTGPHDGSVYLHDIGAMQASINSDQSLGSYTEASVVGDDDNGYRAFVTSITGSVALFDTDGNQIWSGQAPNEKVAQQVEGSTWVQDGSNAEEIGPDGSIVSTVALPEIKPVAANQSGRGGVVGDAPGNVTSWVVTADGDVLDLTTTGAGSAIQDVTSGRVAQIGSYDVVQGAAVGSDGTIYVAAWNLNSTSDTIHVLGIDPSTFDVVSDDDLDIPVEGSKDVSITAGVGGGVVVLVPVQLVSDGGPIVMNLFLVAKNGLVTPGPPLPNNIGLTGSLDGASTLLLYGGPAENVVTEVDLATGDLQVDDALASPPGTYILSIA